MNKGSRLDPPALDAVLQALLDNNPLAPVVAIDANGLFGPMPESFQLGERPILSGSHATILDLVVPEDVRAVIDAWTDARLTGCSRTVVHLASDPEHPIPLDYVDATHSHGVYIGMLEMELTDTSMLALHEAPPLKPRVALVRKNELGFVLEIDDATTQLVGWTAAEMVGKRSLEFIDAEDHARAIANWIDMLRTPGSRRRLRVRHKHRDGSWVWFEITNYNLLTDPEHGYVLSEMLDITDEMLAQEALRAREHLLRRLAEALPQGIFQVDPRGDILYSNERLAWLLGCGSITSVDDVLSTAMDPYRDELRRVLDAALIEGHDADIEVALRRRANDLRRCSFNVRALTDEAGAVTGAIVCVADVTESVQLRRELEERATFDVLTRTYNRASILHVLEQTLASQGAAGTAVIFIDLDRFKDVNDRFGHAAGDAYLLEVAVRLRAAVRDSDVVGRIGGDEFLVVCGGLDRPAEAKAIAERIASELQRTPVVLAESAVLTPSASIGVAWSDDSATSADALVARADQSMYAAKRQRTA